MRNTGALVPLLMWALWSLADSAAVSNYTSGSTCSDDVDAQKALLGKHLNVMELAWAPFAIVDSSAPKGWSGYDIDLLDELATFLGFTYDIVDIGYPDTVGGQTWTSHAANNIDNGDLLMSFWFKNLERLKHLILLDGHVDVSPSLIARREVVASNDAWSWDSLTSFMLPFSWTLWGCLLLLVLLSGLSDYVIERKQSSDARLSASLYEYAAGFLWGGFEYPLSASSKFFQITLAFTFLIVISSYTANLAAFITLSSAPGLSATSIDTAIADNKALCMEQGAYNTRLTANYPRMKYELLLAANTAGDRLSKSDGCDGVLAPKSFYDGWRTDTKNCRLEIAETLFPESAGWMGSKKNLCVVRAINYGLQDLKLRGVVDRMYLKHFPVMACKSINKDVDVAPPEEEPQGTRRRLKSAGNQGSLSGDDSSSDGPVTQIDVAQLKGLFLMWAIVTISLITCTYAHETAWNAIFKRLPPCLKARFMQEVSLGGNDDANPDNEMAMLRDTRGVLRELLEQNRHLKRQFDGLSQHMGYVPESLNAKWQVAKKDNLVKEDRPATLMAAISHMKQTQNDDQKSEVVEVEVESVRGSAQYSTVANGGL